MDPAADSIRQLLDQPQAKRLLAIARSDNPVIALGVTRREQSWTYAMGWLLDPDRDPKVTSAYATAMIRMLRSGAERAVDRLGDDTEASRHLSGLIRLDPNAPIRVEAVATELPLGRAGRVDVVLRCRSGGTPVTVLIENKIDTQERVDQLGGYVRAQGSRLIEGELLAPLLIELGDTPKGLSSCPWAMCWGRSETKEWLHAVQPQSGVARAYAEVFEAWE